MIEIITDQILERGWLSLIDSLECNLIERVFFSSLREHTVGNDRNNTHQVQVVGTP